MTHDPHAQPVIEQYGVQLRRWYLYETDGRRRVTWARDETDALHKGMLSAACTLSDHVEPAPPLGHDAPYEPVARPPARWYP